MTQVRTGITEKYEAIVAAGSEEAMREVASKLTVKELRGIWEKYTPYAEVQRTTGLSKMRKADWVDTVVSMASMEVAKKVAAEAHSATAVEEEAETEQTVESCEEQSHAEPAAGTFAEGQTYQVKLRYGHDTWTVYKRTKCYVLIGSSLWTAKQCKIGKNKAGTEYVNVVRTDLGCEVTVYANSAPAPEASCAESAEATETQTAPAVKEDTVPEQTASATEELTARNRFEVGQIYGKTRRTISIDPNVPSHTYIDSAWLVLSRTKKYITVKNMDPYSSCRGEIKQFYVHSVSEEPYIPHEYFAQRKSSNERYQDRISSLNLMDAEYVLKEVADIIACKFRWAAERIYTHGEHAAVYEPEDSEETFNDHAGDNSNPEQDIPADYEPDIISPAIPVSLPAPVKNQPRHCKPTPKSKKCVFDFSLCKDAETLRKQLADNSVDVLKYIAESYVEFTPLADTKKMNKDFYVEAIVKLYFPDAKPPVKKKTAKATPAGYVRDKFEKGKVYIQVTWRKKAATRLFKVIKCSKGKVTIAEVNPYDFDEFIGLPMTRSVTVNKYDNIEYITPGSKWEPPLCAYYEYNRTYTEVYYTPGYDVAFDETAYSPDFQENTAAVDDCDDISEQRDARPHELMAWSPATSQTAPAESFTAADTTAHRTYTYKLSNGETITATFTPILLSCMPARRARRAPKEHDYSYRPTMSDFMGLDKVFEYCKEAKALESDEDKKWAFIKKLNKEKHGLVNLVYTIMHGAEEKGEEDRAYTLHWRKASDMKETLALVLKKSAIPSKKDELIGCFLGLIEAFEKSLTANEDKPAASKTRVNNKQAAKEQPATATPKPRKRNKKSIDDSRQLTFAFDLPEQVQQDITPSPAVPKTRTPKRARTRKPKLDVSRQLTFSFEIVGGQPYNGKAA